MRNEEENEHIPWREEFNKCKLLGIDYRVNVGRSQVDDIGSCVGKSKSGEGKGEGGG
jgi:hypothetical protein